MMQAASPSCHQGGRGSSLLVPPSIKCYHPLLKPQRVDEFELGRAPRGVTGCRRTATGQFRAHCLLTRISLGQKFELVYQLPESWLLAYGVVGRENEQRTQEGVAFGKRSVKPFESR